MLDGCIMVTMTTSISQITEIYPKLMVMTILQSRMAMKSITILIVIDTMR